MERPSAATSASIFGNTPAVDLRTTPSPTGVDNTGLNHRNSSTQPGAATKAASEETIGGYPHQLVAIAARKQRWGPPPIGMKASFGPAATMSLW